MIRINPGGDSTTRRTLGGAARVLSTLKLDGPLLIGLGLIALFGQVVLYSASGQDWGSVLRGVARIALGTVAMLALAQVKPSLLRRLAPWLFAFGVLLVIIVDAIGYVGKGAQRWLDLGFIRFQPSEIMKLATPMMCAWFLHDRPLPPDTKTLLVLAALIMVPAGLTIIQPDLGTGLLILSAGVLVVLLAGLSVRIIGAMAVAAVGAAWIGWSFLHEYQRLRVLMFLDPQADPLGAGYHIIQSGSPSAPAACSARAG
jgi:rod shape determining protein RodA